MIMRDKTYEALASGKRRFRIVPKRDFGSGRGYWIAGAGNTGTLRYGFVKHGFVVTDGLCNIMPGATWFLTVTSAMRAIRIYIAVKGDGPAFWEEIKGDGGVALT